MTIMLAHWIGQQTEKLRAQQKAEGHAEGRVEGSTEKDAVWREWYERQLARGFIPAEPPPAPESPDGKE